MGIIHTVISELQSRHAAIEGIKFAPLELKQYPATPAAHQLPCALTYPAAGEWHREGFGGPLRRNGTYTVRVLTQVASGGMNVPTNLHEMVDLIERLGEMYLDPFNTTLVDDGQYQITMDSEAFGDFTDTGVMAMIALGDAQFYGFSFNLTIFSTKNGGTD